MPKKTTVVDTIKNAVRHRSSEEVIVPFVPTTVKFPGAVVNENGQVAIRYYQTIPKRVTVNKHDYAFSVQHNVSLAWVEESDVATLLNTVGGCCGNPQKGVFKLCSQTNVNLWRTGER